jgi:hypothetical protein
MQLHALRGSNLEKCRRPTNNIAQEDKKQKERAEPGEASLMGSFTRARQGLDPNKSSCLYDHQRLVVLHFVFGGPSIDLAEDRSSKLLC